MNTSGKLSALLQEMRGQAGLEEAVGLTKHARSIYKLSAEDGDHRRATREAAIAVGRHAKRLGKSKAEVKRWLQDEYGATFVRQAGLKPPYSLAEVWKFIASGM